MEIKLIRRLFNCIAPTICVVVYVCVERVMGFFFNLVDV